MSYLSTGHYRDDVLGRYYSGPVMSQRSSSVTDGVEVFHSTPRFVRDTSKYWYKPGISREEGEPAVFPQEIFFQPASGKLC